MGYGITATSQSKEEGMSIFPQLSPDYYSEKHRDVIARMENFYSESITLNQSFWAEADIDTRFYAGEVSLWSELYPNLPANRRRLFNFNRIRRIINMISGHQRRTRKSMIAIPVENADQDTADQFSKILIHVSEKDQALETISEAFEGALITGMNLLHVWLDFRDDPVSGTIRVDKCDYNSFLIDPYFKKTDLSDCNGLWKRSYLTKQEVVSLLPNHADEIIELSPNATGQDNKFQYMPENYGWSYKNLLAYDEFYYRDYRTAKILVDSQTGETLEWRSENDDRLKEYLRTFPQVTVMTTEIPTVKMAVVVQGRVFYNGPNPLGIDRYPFVPVFAYYNPQIPYYYLRVQGVVRDLRDAQYLYARRKVIELDILESQINSGWIYKENALVNPKDVFLAGQGRGLALKDSAQMSDVQQIQPPQIPASMFKLSEQLAREVMEVSGVNEELLGAANDDKAGVLAMLRQGAGLTTLQGLFDKLDQSQKLLGRLIIETVQSNYTQGKVQKIIDEPPTQQFYTKAFGKYDCRVEDGLNTATQKQMQFAQLLQMRELGVQIPDDLLVESSTLQNKNDLVKALQQQAQQQQQQQQQQLQSAMQEQQARVNLANARAKADEGLGVERLSRVQENRALAVERMAEANKDDELALLNKVRAIKELEEMDINRLRQLLELANYLKETERQQTQLVPQESSLQALQSLGQPSTEGTGSIPGPV